MSKDIVRLSVEGTSGARAEFRRRLRRHVGLRVQVLPASIALEIDADRIEAVGPAAEAAAIAAGVTLRLADLGAAVQSVDLQGRPSSVWAAIGDAADRRSVDRDRGAPESVPLLYLVGVETENGHLVAVDGRPRLVDYPTAVPPDHFPTKFDDAGWHADSAAASGQPPEHAWTHIALFLTWLIRHDLVDRSMVGSGAARVRNGGVVDAALMQSLDMKLVSDVMTDRGISFTEATYRDYLTAYDQLFSSEPDYSVAASPGTYARIEPDIDALWGAWWSSAASLPDELLNDGEREGGE